MRQKPTQGQTAAWIEEQTGLPGNIILDAPAVPWEDSEFWHNHVAELNLAHLGIQPLPLPDVAAGPTKAPVVAQPRQNPLARHETSVSTQICTNGHVVTVDAAFCEKCGKTAISECPKCNTKIRTASSPPGFCYRCGTAFPWEAKKQEAIALFLDETQDIEARRAFDESVTQIAKDTPQAEAASKRINGLLGKVSKGAASAIRDILVSVASETVKKILMPGG